MRLLASACMCSHNRVYLFSPVFVPPESDRLFISLRPICLSHHFLPRFIMTSIPTLVFCSILSISPYFWKNHLTVLERFLGKRTHRYFPFIRSRFLFVASSSSFWKVGWSHHVDSSSSADHEKTPFTLYITLASWARQEEITLGLAPLFFFITDEP